MELNWRTCSDWAKKRPATLRLAEALGRGCGRMRILDQVSRPTRAPRVPDLAGWTEHPLAAAWIGHATVLLRIAGQTVLTDPVFSNRVGLDLGLITGGPRRLTAPALSIGQLPAIDVVLISHAHFDHLDRPTLARLPKSAHVITSEHNRDLLDDFGFASVRELRWGESTRVGALEVKALPVRHWGARTFHDQHRGYCGFLLEGGGRRVLYGGDTAAGEHFSGLGGLDLAVLGIGGYHPYVQAHATPEQAWEMACRAGAERILPIHHSTFRLSYEPTSEPLTRLLRTAGSDVRRIVGTEIGSTWTLEN